MNNKLIGAGIALALVAVLIFVVFGAKTGNKTGAAPVFKSVKGSISEDNVDEAKAKLDSMTAEDPDLSGAGEQYFEIARLYENKNEPVKARDVYRIILDKYQNIENILEAQEGLGRLNVEILFSPLVTDRDELYTVEPGDTLFKIAKQFGTTIDLIKRSNSLKDDVIRVGAKLKISNADYSILVDKSQNILTLFSDGVVFKVYRVSTGENNSTPVGPFKIINKIKDPVWYNEGAIVPAESPDNILGSRWLGISEPGYGIHGTVDPDSVGRQATRGCVRMLNSDVEELYTIVPSGIEVTIVD